MEGGPPCFRPDSSCPGVLRYGAKRLPRASPTGLSPAPAGLPRPFGCARNHRRLPRRRPTTPPASPPSVWAPPRSLAATGGISFDFFSCGYLDGSLPRVSPPHTISFMCGCSPFQVSGLPHSETPASSDVCSYTGLFAACRVLPRLAAPRHPPWTLFSLDHIVLLCSLTLQMCKKLLCLEAGGLEPPTPGLQSRCSSQLSYAPGRLMTGIRMGRERTGRTFSSSAGLPTCRPTAIFHPCGSCETIRTMPFLPERR